LVLTARLEPWGRGKVGRQNCMAVAKWPMAVLAKGKMANIIPPYLGRHKAPRISRMYKEFE
jgi:hypothetical protein